MPSPQALRTRGRRLAVLLAVPLLILAVATILVTQPHWAISLLDRAFPAMLFRVETEAKAVALTFDDGPDDVHTARVLEVLARNDAHATFFMIGGRAVGRQAIVQAVREAGHEIGNHYFTIGSALQATDDRFAADVMRAERALGLEDADPKLFRPPSGLFTHAQLQILRGHDYRAVLGSAYPFDTSRPPSAYMRWLVTKNLEPGAIVILHDGVKDPTSMLVALEGILEEGRRRGLRFVSVGELLRTGGPAVQ